MRLKSPLIGCAATKTPWVMSFHSSGCSGTAVSAKYFPGVKKTERMWSAATWNCDPEGATVQILPSPKTAPGTVHRAADFGSDRADHVGKESHGGAVIDAHHGGAAVMQAPMDPGEGQVLRRSRAQGSRSAIRTPKDREFTPAHHSVARSRSTTNARNPSQLALPGCTIRQVAGSFFFRSKCR